MRIPFEDRVEEIKKEIQKRKNKWQLSTLPFEDVSQILLIRAFNKYHTYDEEKAPFSHWINRLISNGMRNILRDNLGIYSRPCIMGCVYNLGDDFCGYTNSKKQCSECSLYAKWEKKKKNHFNIAQSLPLVNHEQEVNSKIDDFFDIKSSKEIIDKKLKEKLNQEDWTIYNMLFIQNKNIEYVESFFVKKKYNKKINYQYINKFKKRMVLIVKQIISDEGLS